jgi:tetratricopeptide (TPR) repeat protein
MRIALLLDGTPRTHSDQTLDTARLVRLPPSARLSNALGSCLGADARDASGVFVLAPVGDGVLHGDAWSTIARGVAELDDDLAIEAEIAEASRLLDLGCVDEAHDAYVRCDLLLAEENSARRVEVLARLAEIAERRGAIEDAAQRLDQALALFPMHRGAIHKRMVLARSTGDMVTAAALGARVLPLAQSNEERVAAHRQIAEDCLQAAAFAMRAALTLDRGDPELLERLRAVLEAGERFDESVDVAVALAEQLQDAPSRARALVTAADKCARRTGNAPRAVALYEAAITDDPEVPGAFEAIESVLLESRDFAGAERAYARQLERLEGRPVAQAALLQKLARVREVELDDRAGAIAALERLLVLRPGDIEARAKVAAMLEADGQDAAASRCLEVMTWQAPARAATFEMLHRIFARSGDTDRAYAAAGVLVHLGEADLDEQLTYHQFAPEGTPRAVEAIDEAEWEMLQPDGHDADLTTILQAVAPAAVTMRVDEMRAQKLIPRLGERHYLDRSTVGAVRIVGTLTRLLGMDAPEVYVHAQEVPGGIAVLPSNEPAIALGPSILTGRSLPELTFLIARELASLKLTGRVLALYPTIPDLTKLLNATIALAVPQRQLALDVLALKNQLATRMSAVQRRALSVAVRQLIARESAPDLLDWVKGIERTACRAALLATGDITVAARMLAIDGRAIGGMSAAERVRDLVPFSVSQRYSGLRSAIGVAARSSILP